MTSELLELCQTSCEKIDIDDLENLILRLWEIEKSLRIESYIK